MYRKTILLVACIVALIIAFNIPLSQTAAGQAAPYTQEAYGNINRVLKEYPAPTPGVNVAPIDKHKASLEYFREVFYRAGYDWDATIRAVADDVKNNSGRIPTRGENVATMVIVLMSYMKSHCEYDQVDCLALFDSSTSDAVKWLWRNTRFKP
jgi:hypothetical protein